MTTPVIRSVGKSDKDWVNSFSMPSKCADTNLPSPNNERVYLENIQPTTAAVIGFSNFANEVTLLKKTKRLLTWLKKKKYEIRSKPKYLFYKDPSTP